MKETFAILDEFIPLNKLLKASGVASSGALASHMIEEGEVRVDGAVELRKRCKIKPGQIVTVADNEILVTEGNQ